MALDIQRQNKAYEFSNSSVSKILASKADDTAAKAAGLAKGDIYHTTGTLKIVVG